MAYIKYPRTEHLIGSKVLEPSHFNLNLKDSQSYSFPLLQPGQFFVVEEKMDGIGLGIFFIDDKIHIQQRGHIFPLSDLPELLKNFQAWVQHNEEMLYCIIGNRYTLFGEWLEFKHTVFYNYLPSLFLEYDMFDHEHNLFVSTQERYRLINQQIPSVNVLAVLHNLDLSGIKKLLLDNPVSHFNNHNWDNDYLNNLKHFPQLAQDTVQKGSYEGFYIKVENQSHVVSRFKWILKEFFDIVAHNEHWKNKPIIKNKLASSLLITSVKP